MALTRLIKLAFHAVNDHLVEVAHFRERIADTVDKVFAEVLKTIP